VAEEAGGPSRRIEVVDGARRRESYEEAVRRLSGGKERLESSVDWPVEGVLSHAAGEGEGGFRVVDV
jgi:hypothetical protein